MVKTILLLLLLLYTRLLLGQEPPSYFEAVNWSITLPAGYYALDSMENEKLTRKGIEKMEETNHLKADISGLVTLFSIRKNALNYFNATLTPFDPGKDGDYDSTSRVVNEIVYNTFAQSMPKAQIDSSSNTIVIDHLPFRQFEITVHISQDISLTSVLLCCLYKGYDFGISYVYTEALTKKEIEQSLGSSRFQ